MNFTLISTASTTASFAGHLLPLYTGGVSCGLFGISDDFAEERLSLDGHLIKNWEATFLVRASGDSMRPKIENGDILVVDRSVELKSGMIGTFFYRGEPICKQYVKKGEQAFLVSLNTKYKPILLNDEDELELFGVVTALARNFIGIV